MRVPNFNMQFERLSRRLALFLSLFGICLSASAMLDPVDDSPPRFKVFVDAGHGGRDLGAKGLLGLEEKNLSLKVSRLLRDELLRSHWIRKIPVEIKLSREDDTFLTLSERVRRANVWGADLFLSIHGNSSTLEKARGFEVYFLSEEASDEAAGRLAKKENLNGHSVTSVVASILSDLQINQHVTESSALAEVIFKDLAREFKPNGRGVRQAPFTVLAGTQMPAVLVELGFVTQSEEAKNLLRVPYLKRLASAISRGVIDYLVSRKRVI